MGSTDDGTGPAPRGAAARALRALYFVVCNTLLLLVALEVSWRLVDGEPPPQKKVNAPDRVGYGLHPFFQTTNAPNPRADRGPHYQGWWIEPKDAAEEGGRLRVLFLGGSTTMTDYPSYVRAELEDDLGPITVFNLGSDWHTSLHSLMKWWTYAERIEPDLVVVLHAVNDLVRSFTAPKYALPEYRSDYGHYAGPLHYFWSPGTSLYDQRPVFHSPLADRHAARLAAVDTTLAGLGRDLLGRSAVVRGLLGTDGGAVAPEGRPVTGPTVEVDVPDELLFRSHDTFHHAMTSLADAARGAEVPALFLTMPHTLDAPSKTFVLPGRLLTNDGREHASRASFVRGMEHYNGTVRGLATDGATVLDLERELTDPALFTDEVHLTDEGLREEARRVAEYILAEGLLAR